MTINRKTTFRYSFSFKQQVVKEVESGVGFEALRRRYGIKGGQTIQEWVRKFGKDHLLNKIVRVETLDEKDRMKSLEEEVKKLKLALADSLLAQRSLEVVINEANKEYKTDLKKNFGDSASSNLEKTSQ
jgi:transposase-like protein